METLDLQWQTFKALLDWRVTLDIVLIAAGIFFLYHTLRTSGSWKIVSGVMIAVVIFMAARLLGLRGIEWIYSNLSHVLLLALIVIFQPEIRRFLERAASLRPQETVVAGANIANVISDVVFALAEKRRGAIVVFPGKESIQPWSSEGIALDAKASFPILMSIFDPNSPGHDGAVVIDKGKIAAFGVRLPLSKSGNLAEEFGTRHHAALGLSEVTDAFVIAVSEERGTVTVFRHGATIKIDAKEKLSSDILIHFRKAATYELPGSTATDRKTLVTELAVSLLLAFLFWSTVILTQGR